ncbi:ExbD/TolR family protein [Phycisphaerales bacterium AB-hyl4]|uniref:ExbD/TolR family protein n=1 Tax=Natronomicrosphaera hydrolytica TaxID=3242702 RepID=A0ABV4U3J1_9BACT
MPSQVFKRGPTAPEMNITPLIDVVFLLIVFFMIVSNIVTHQAVEMFVPDLDDSQAQVIPEEGRVIVNVAPQAFTRATRAADPLRFSGSARMVQVANQSYAMHDLAGVTASLERAVERNPEVEVVLRADRAIYYSEVQPVMDAITAAGVNRVNLVSFDPVQ